MTNGVMSRWTREQYEADKTRCRSTSLKDILSDQGPRLYYLKHVTRSLQPEPDANDHIQPEVDDLILGTIFHEFLLEQIENWFVCTHRRGTNAWKDAIEENAQKWAIKPRQEKQLLGMRDSVMASKRCRAVLEQGGFTEQTFLWDYELDNGQLIPSKCRIDWLASDGSIFDLKTTRHANRRDFTNQCIDLDYGFSAAFYESGRNSVPEFNGMDNAEFYHITVCKQPPYWAYLHPFDKSWLAMGRRSVKKAMTALSKCLTDQIPLLLAGADPLTAWPDLLEETEMRREAVPNYVLAREAESRTHS